MFDKSELSSPDKQELLKKIAEEVALRGYSSQTEKSYTFYTEKFLNSRLSLRDFLLNYSKSSSSTVRSVYFALQFFFENVLRENFSEKTPLARKDSKLPTVLSREEVSNLINSASNQKHKLVLMLLYYAGLRLSEVRKLCWQDVDFSRGFIHVRLAKGKKGQDGFPARKNKGLA